MGSNSQSHYICIRNAPLTWNSGVVQGMFFQYGPIEDISIEQNSSNSTNFVIVEFECIEDAEAAVEDNENSEHRVTFYRQNEETSSGSTVIITSSSSSTPKDSCDTVEAIHCSNQNCTNQVVVERPCEHLMGNKKMIYCSHECYCELLDMKGRVNIYDKWIASLGRSGTGMLKDTSKLDKIVITVDSDGVRRIDIKQ